jgi:hypothetical protein
MAEQPSRGAQLLGSLLAAVTIVAVAIAVVTAHFGPTSSAELESREERLEERLKQREEIREERQELREERLEQGR